MSFFVSIVDYGFAKKKRNDNQKGDLLFTDTTHSQLISKSKLFHTKFNLIRFYAILEILVLAFPFTIQRANEIVN